MSRIFNPDIDPFDPPMVSAGAVTLDLKRRLWLRYSTNHVVLYEVPIDGHKLVISRGDQQLHEVPSRQSIDAIAVGMWRSTRHVIHAFEIKASVSDLVSELMHPIKSRAAMRVADYFWLVVPSRTMYAGLVLPESWGVLESYTRGLRIVRQAKCLTDGLDRHFVADMIGAAVNRVHDPAVMKLPSRRRRRRWSG